MKYVKFSIDNASSVLGINTFTYTPRFASEQDFETHFYFRFHFQLNNFT